MPRVKKSKNVKKVSKTTASKAPKVTKAAKATKATKVTAPAVDVKIPAPVEVKPEGPTLSENFAELLAQLTALRSQLTSVTGQVRALQKRSERELRNAQKAGKKRKQRSGSRAPSGFVKPTKISSELANFLGKPKGTEMARTDVTREINSYIRAHKLQDPKNGRRILADAKLRKLLKLPKNDELTYFNLQRYMSPHFAKSAKKKAEAAAASQ